MHGGIVSTCNRLEELGHLFLCFNNKRHSQTKKKTQQKNQTVGQTSNVYTIEKPFVFVQEAQPSFMLLDSII